MVTLMALWLPIVVSAVGVFVLSSLFHQVLPHHRGDYAKLPNEDGVLEALRATNLPPGQYMFPHCTHQTMGSEETKAKFARGPIGVVLVRGGNPLAMGKTLATWFCYLLVVNIVVAYLTGRTVAPSADYLAAFRVAGTAALLAHVGYAPVLAIWFGAAWGPTLKHMLDGLVYALFTAGVFGWLWP